MERLKNVDSGINVTRAPDAEEALLACVIDNPSRFAAKMWEAEISAEYFDDPANSELFQILSQRIREDKAIDPASLRDHIRQTKPAHLKVTRIVDVTNCEKSEDGWDGYVGSLREAHAHRLIQSASDVSGGHTAGEVLERLRGAILAAQGAISGNSSVADSKTSVELFRQAMHERIKAGKNPGLTTGIMEFDAHTGGMRSGELWVVGAKTSGGKSILMLQMATEAIRQGKNVAIFTLELGIDEVMCRLLSCMNKIPMSELMLTEPMKKHTQNKLAVVLPELAQSNIHICDTPDMTMDTIAGHCSKLKDTCGLDLVIIDYVQQVSVPHVKGQAREQEVAAISRSCKQLAKRMKCPVLTATQLNNDGQSRESRAIEHDADNVILIDHDKEGATIKFWKCRNGQRGTEYKATMDGLHQKFTITL